ncbi:MAG: hypothetical protein JXA16_11910 [Bacteroidales bacterium]|nr:hypothetical protein [Bacteroidales bacterium]
MKMNRKINTKLTVIEITPLTFQCGVGVCPSIFKTNRETFILVGKKLNSKDITQEIKNKIGPDEDAVEIPKKLLTELFS